MPAYEETLHKEGVMKRLDILIGITCSVVLSIILVLSGSAIIRGNMLKETMIKTNSASIGKMAQIMQQINSRLIVIEEIKKKR